MPSLVSTKGALNLAHHSKGGWPGWFIDQDESMSWSEATLSAAARTHSSSAPLSLSFP